jgi:hypothetical protein
MNNSSKPNKTTNKFLAFLQDNADWMVKLTAAFVAVFVAIIANSYESKMAAVSMFNQREQAESELRANMFSNLIDPIAGPKKDGDIGVKRLLLLTELLTLNFHEHFEFKPLLEYVDARLEENNETNATEIEQARSSLKSIARRIVDRQIASIMQEGSGKDRTIIEEVAFIQPPEMGDDNKTYVEHNFTSDMGDYVLHKKDGLWETISEKEKAYSFGDRLTTMSPDKNWRLEISVSRFSSEKEENVEIYLDLSKDDQGEDATAKGLNKDFSLSRFDFPLTDNTLLSDGNRYAIVLDDVEDIIFRNDSNASDTFKTENVLLKVIWFPKNYFTPRERPIDYDKFLDKTGLKRD